MLQPLSVILVIVRAVQTRILGLNGRTYLGTFISVSLLVLFFLPPSFLLMPLSVFKVHISAFSICPCLSVCLLFDVRNGDLVDNQWTLSSCLGINFNLWRCSIPVNSATTSRKTLQFLLFIFRGEMSQIGQTFSFYWGRCCLMILWKN